MVCLQSVNDQLLNKTGTFRLRLSLRVPFLLLRALIPIPKSRDRSSICPGQINNPPLQKHRKLFSGSVAETENFAPNRGVGSPHPTPNSCYYYICCIDLGNRPFGKCYNIGVSLF